MASTSTIKTTALCVFLFLTSALMTLSLKSTPNTPSSLLHQPTSPSHNQDPLTPKVAFATFLTDNAGQDPSDPSVEDNADGFYLGARVLAYQLLHAPTATAPNKTSSSPSPRIPFLVLCTTDLSARKRARLTADGATVILVEKLDIPPDTENVDLTKLRLFQLTAYHKICYLSPATLITASLDGIFYGAATLTQATSSADPALNHPPDHDDVEAPTLPRTYVFASHANFSSYEHAYPPTKVPDLSAPFNTAFFVFAPSLPLFSYYLSLLCTTPPPPEGAREKKKLNTAQDLLNYAHRREGPLAVAAAVARLERRLPDGAGLARGREEFPGAVLG